MNVPYSSKSDIYNSRNGTYGRESHREGSSNADSGFSAVRERVQMGIATSHSHTEVLQDMVLNLSEGSSKRDVDHDKSILKDLVKEMVTFRYHKCSLIVKQSAQCMWLQTSEGSASFLPCITQRATFTFCTGVLLVASDGCRHCHCMACCTSWMSWVLDWAPVPFASACQLWGQTPRSITRVLSYARLNAAAGTSSRALWRH